jgi:tRNA (guanine26-N2/guanine27-N2)-dimethyltransferase
MKEEAKQRILRLGEKAENLLTLVKNESGTSVSYYVIDELCHVLRLPVPPVKKVVEALKKAGFEAFLTHFDPRGIKSNAPATKIESILRGITNGRRQVLNNLSS